MNYLLHRNYEGDPIGVWNEYGESRYGVDDSKLKRSAEYMMKTRHAKQTWDDFSDRLDDRISHRDWWEVYESDQTDINQVWYEIVPSDEPLFDVTNTTDSN